jgi:uncharacterized membrane protein
MEDRIVRQPAHGGRLWLLEFLALPLVIALAAANFLWQLRSSSYFVDELISINAALQPLGNVLHTVGQTEITPPAYFLFQHLWLGALGGTRAEWATRLPSALCGELLVMAVYWLASLLSGRRAVALLAAALTACCPFVLEFAQLAQPYVFAALAVTVAVAAAIEAERATSRQTAWLCGAVTAAALSLTIHYTATLVIAPLCVWVASRRSIPRRWRVAMAASCLLVEIALVPLLVTQHQSFPTRAGVSLVGALTPSTLVDMLEVPFAGRVAPLRGLGVVLTLETILVLAVGARQFFGDRSFGAGRRLVIIIAAGVPLALVVLSAVGGNSFWGHLMLTRYAAVGAPFIIVTMVLAWAELPKVFGGVLAAAAAALAIVGLIDSHRREGFFLDTRGAAHYVHSRARTSDAVIVPDDRSASLVLGFYGLGPLRPYVNGSSTTNNLVASHRRRLWVVLELPSHNTPTSAGLLSLERQAARPCGYQVLDAHVFTAATPLGVILEAPTAGRARCL